MANTGAALLLARIRKMVETDDPNIADSQLLDQFIQRRDPAAFARLVERHGPMVLAVGRRVLGDRHTAEDVYQATFLVLARKAASIRNQTSLCSWLHGVAYRLAQKARVESARRQAREKQAAVVKSSDAIHEVSWHELCAVLDEELQRMPEKLRVPLVLCYLEGRTRDEAARTLGWSLRTLHRHLERGRNLLNVRLSRRGVTFSAALLATTLEQSVASSAVSAGLIATACEAGVAFAEAGYIGAGANCTGAAAMAEGAIKAMHMTSLKIARAWALTVAGVVAAGGVLSYRAATIQNSVVEQAEAPRAAPGLVKRSAPLPEKALKNQAETLLKEALTALESASGSQQYRVVADIGALQARLGDPTSARKTLQKASDLVDAMPGDHVNELRMLAGEYASAGELEGALAVIKQLPSPKPRDNDRPGIDQAVTLEECASILARARREKDALRFVDLIEDQETRKWVRPWVLTQLAQVLAEAGDFTRALQILDALPDAADKIQVLAGLTVFNFSWSEDPGLEGIAILQSQAGDRVGARKSLRLAIDLVGTLQGNEKKPRALASIATAQARLGDLMSALESAENVGGKQWKGKALVAVARALAAAGKDKEARQIVDALQDQSTKTYGLYQLAQGQERAKETQAARETFRQAIDLAKTVDAEKINHFYNIATAQAMIGDIEEAIQTVKANITEPNQALAFSSIANQQAKAGDVKGALQTAQQMDECWWKGNTLRVIAKLDAERRQDMEPPD
jgi:RNA polymerase sigma factor (sigma-70 family)